MTVELHQSAEKYLESRFNLVLRMNARDFDHDWKILIDALKQIQRPKFSNRDRILICHMDTDYYDPLLPTGIIINNLIRSFQLMDIPLYLLLFVTNHYGIAREFDLLLNNHHPADRPAVIETLLSPILLSETDYDDRDDLDAHCIERAALCLVGKQRSHRVALLNFLKNNQLLNHVAVSANFANS